MILADFSIRSPLVSFPVISNVGGIIMIISTRGRYALRVMIDLAGQDPNTYTPLKEIAARQEISEKYLENILKSLVTGGLIFGLRGKGGGYKLTKKPEDYTISSILRLTEGSLAPVACLEENATECEREAVCPTRPLWKKLDTLIQDYLGSVSLKDLIDGTV